MATYTIIIPAIESLAMLAIYPDPSLGDTDDAAYATDWQLPPDSDPSPAPTAILTLFNGHDAV